MAECRIQRREARDRKTKEVLYTGKWISTLPSALRNIRSSGPSPFIPLTRPTWSRAEEYPWGDERKVGQPGFESLLLLAWSLERRLTHCTHRRQGLTTGHINWQSLSGCWSLIRHPKPQCKRRADEFPLGCEYYLIWLKWLWLRLWRS